MRALWVIHYPTFSGPHNRVLRLAPKLRAHGVSVTVVLPDKAGNANQRLADAGVDVVRVPLSRVRASMNPRTHGRFARHFAAEVHALRALIREQRADVVVVGGLVNPHAAVAAHREGVAVVWQVIDTRTPPAACRALAPVVHRCADTVQFGAEALIERNFGARAFPCPMVVLRPSVDVELFRPSDARRHAIRNVLGIPPNAQVVGTVANVTPQKGIEWFARAARLLATVRPDTWFVVIGALSPTHRSYTSMVRHEVDRSGVAERFVFAGARHDVERCYPGFDVKLITSVPRSEGTTTTALEALACGVPVVAADVGAVREAVDHGASGWIVPPNRPDAMAQAAAALLDDDAMRTRMGATGRTAVERRFSTHEAAPAQVAILENAIAYRRARR